MASRYWVGGTSTWNATAGSKWAATSGGAGGQSVPTAADDVFFDSNSTGTCTLSSSSVCRSLDCNGFSGTISHPSSTALVIGDGTAGAGNIALRFSAGMTYTKGSTTTSSVTLQSSSATQQSITLNGKVLGNFTIVSASLVLGDAFESTGSFSFTSGTLDTANNDFEFLSITSINSNTRSLTLGSSNVLIHGSFFVSEENFTLNAGTSTITIDSSSSISFSGDFTYYNVVITSLLADINAAAVFNNLTVNGISDPRSAVEITSNDITVNDTFTAAGVSANQYRLTLKRGDVINFTRTITAENTSLTNVDIYGITGAGNAAWSGTSVGNIGQCSGITFTTPVVRYWVGNSGNWSDSSHWSASDGGSSGASVPIVHDTTLFTSNSISSGSQTVTINVRNISSINMISVLNSPDVALANHVDVFGDIQTANGVTFSGSGAFIMRCGGSTASRNIQGGIGTVFNNAGIIFTRDEGFDTTVELGADLTLGSTSIIGHGGGTFDTNGFNVTCGGFTADQTNSIFTGTGISFTIFDTIVQTGTGGTWEFTGTGTSRFSDVSNDPIVLQGSPINIVVSNVTATAKTIVLNDFTFGDITITGDNVTLAGSNTFDAFNVNNAGLTNGLKLANGSTQTISSFSSNGSSGNLSRIQAVSTSASLSKASGFVSEDYLNLTNVVATGGALWYAGANSTNGGGNTGWTFTAPPGEPIVSLVTNDEQEIPNVLPTLRFAGLDIQDDDITYQIQIDDTDDTFASIVVDAESDADPGFNDVTNGVDTDPFASEDTVSYTVQAGSELIVDTIYYWRVRGKDPGGTDTYGDWSEVREFTIVESSSGALLAFFF